MPYVTVNPPCPRCGCPYGGSTTHACNPAFYTHQRVLDDRPCENCGRSEGAHGDVVGIGKVCPIQIIPTYRPRAR